MFVDEFKKYTGATWIMKPVGRSQGAGIFLVNKLAQTQQWKPRQDLDRLVLVWGVFLGCSE